MRANLSKRIFLWSVYVFGELILIYLEEGWPIGGEGDYAPGVARVGDQGAPHL
jgi:hypothetical protein